MRTTIRPLAAAIAMVAATQATAAFHLWTMKELYSNASGTVQFLELVALSGGQQFLSGHTLTANNGGPNNTFNFATNLPGDTTGKRFLVGTQGFAALGLVTPDYVVPNSFFFRTGGTINFAEGSDSWIHTAIPAGANSLDRTAPAGVNSPTNFAGATATIRVAALDTTFGTGGIAAFPGYSLAVQADGRIVALGAATTTAIGSNHNFFFALRRLTTAGALDVSTNPQVNSCGFCTAPVTSTAGTLLQPDGRIVSVGHTQSSALNTGACKTVGYALMRHTTAIGLDNTFSGDGLTTAGGGEAHGIALQVDGKIVVAGSKRNYGCLSADQPMDTQVVRFNADGMADNSFGSFGSVISQLGSADDFANAVAVQPDGRIVIAGEAYNGTNKDFTVARYSTAGVIEAGSTLLDVTTGANDVAYALVLQADGKIVAAGSSGTRSAIVRLTAPGTYDAGFAAAGKFLLPGTAVRGLALQADGKILAVTSDGDLLRLGTNGALDTAFGVGGRVSLATANVQSLALQADGRILVGTSTNVMRVDPDAIIPITPDSASLDFGGQSMNTTSPVRTLKLVNTSGSAQSITTVTAPANFGATHNCDALAIGASCTVSLTYTPTTQDSHVADLVIAGSAGTVKIFLAGMGERSLVTHYYRSILRRDPDAGGKTFWGSEATRVTALGPSVNEVWFAMAQSFYFSTEYAAFNRDNTGFATDLYNTFFNRAPDSGGLAFWVGQLASGMPREVALASFMFSTEFANFTSAIFGSATVRAEVNTVVDFYRGLLARLPDDGGFNFWLGKFRTAQCAGAAAVTAEVEAISSAYALSSEYTARARSNSQYIGDLYNAFLRRGGDLGGVQFWILQLSTRTREAIRVEFKNSTEFQARVAAIIAQGCM